MDKLNGEELNGMRLPIESIDQMDDQKRSEKIDDIKKSVYFNLTAFQNDNPKLKTGFDKQDLDRVVTWISETLVESKYVLKVSSLVPIDFFDDGEPQGENGNRINFGIYTSDHDIDTISMNIKDLIDYTKDKRQNSESGLKKVRYEIRTGIAHEVAHLYITRELPTADVRSVEASRNALDGDYDEYRTDRGEKFANLFGKKYAKFKDDQFDRERKKYA